MLEALKENGCILESSMRSRILDVIKVVPWCTIKG